MVGFQSQANEIYEPQLAAVLYKYISNLIGGTEKSIIYILNFPEEEACSGR